MSTPDVIGLVLLITGGLSFGTMFVMILRNALKPPHKKEEPKQPYITTVQITLFEKPSLKAFFIYFTGSYEE